MARPGSDDAEGFAARRRGDALDGHPRRPGLGMPGHEQFARGWHAAGPMDSIDEVMADLAFTTEEAELWADWER